MHICLDTVGFKFIDGRKDATLLIEHDAHTGKCHQKTELQMHIVVCWQTRYSLLNAGVTRW